MPLLSSLRSTAILKLPPNAFLQQNINKTLQLIVIDLIAINAAAGSGGGGGSITAEEGVSAAGGGQGGATACTKMYTFIDTVAVANDGVLALAATNAGGSAVFQYFQNNTANDCYLYPQSGENFEGEAANAPITISAFGQVSIVCATTGSYRYF